MSEFDHLSDRELSALVARLAAQLLRAQGEQTERFHTQLETAMGAEFALATSTGSLWNAVRFRSDGAPEIIWCFYCGARPGWQEEHKTPRGRGGSNASTNIVRACATCNYRKGLMSLEEYRSPLSQITSRRHVFFGERTRK